MAPKAAEKKAAPKKAITYVPKEIDASKYIRKVRYNSCFFCTAF